MIIVGFKDTYVPDDDLMNKVSVEAQQERQLDDEYYFKKLFSYITNDKHKLITMMLFMGFKKGQTANVLGIHPSAISKAIERTILPAISQTHKDYE